MRYFLISFQYNFKDTEKQGIGMSYIESIKFPNVEQVEKNFKSEHKDLNTIDTFIIIFIYEFQSALDFFDFKGHTQMIDKELNNE